MRKVISLDVNFVRNICNNYYTVMNNYYKITMEIKKKTIMTLMIALMAIPVVGQKSECCNSQCQSEAEIFLYSPDE